MDIPSGAKKFVAVVGMDDEVIAQMTANKVTCLTAIRSIMYILLFYNDKYMWYLS